MLLAVAALLCTNQQMPHDYDEDLDPTKLPDGYNYDDRYFEPGGDFFVEEGFHSTGDDDWGYDSYAYGEREPNDDALQTNGAERPQRMHVGTDANGRQAAMEDAQGFDDAFVTALTAETFDLIVHDPTHDVLIAFIAPWCGHCKALAPEFAKAADLLAADFPTLVLAKYDVTSHKVPNGFDVSGYPTLLFVPAATHASPQRYTGGRHAEEIVQWMKSRALSFDKRLLVNRKRAIRS